MLTQQINLSALDEEARQELLSFYQFLLQKVNSKRQEKQTTLPQTFYQPLKVNEYVAFERNEIYEQR